MTTDRPMSARVGDWARTHPRLLAAIVSVAALTLVGTAFILASTVFSSIPVAGEVDPTPSLSESVAPSPSPSAHPSASAALSESAAPTPLAGPAWPPVGDTSFEGLLPPMWAVSVVNDLNVRSGPGTEHPAVGRLDAGDVALVMDDLDVTWVQVAVDGAIGYVNAGPTGDRYLLPTKTPWLASNRSIAGVASDGETYIAYGSQLALDYPFYELHGIPSLLLRSEDGITWTEVDSELEFSLRAMEGSESGWVAIVSVPFGATAMAYSADGSAWEPVGDEEGQQAVAYGPAGWVAIGADQAWTSTDGRSWDGPLAMGLGEIGMNLELESSASGYVAFDPYDSYPGTLIASSDGVAWSSYDIGNVRVSDVELVGDRVLAVLSGAEGATTLRRGRFGADGRITWDGAARSVDDAEFHIDRITQGPDGLLAIGWNQTDLLPVTWRSTDGATWERLPSGENGLEGVGSIEPVWGAGGWVGQGLERSTDGQSWTQSEYSLAYDGPVPPCPPAEKVSVIVLAYLGRYAEDCFGDEPITVRGWVPMFEGFGGIHPISGTTWLGAHYPQGILASGRSEGLATYQLGVFVPPEVDGDIFNERELWLEVVGHYRDPSSANCRYEPRTDMRSFLPSIETAQATCRERFVVESVTEVDGP